jgi:hypothetical protein
MQHSEGLHILHSSQNIIRQKKSRRMRWAGHVARKEEERKVHKVLVGKRPLRRPRHKWEDGIKISLGTLAGGRGVNSIGSGWESMAGSYEYGDEPIGSWYQGLS